MPDMMEFRRHDFSVESDPGIGIFVRRVDRKEGSCKIPVLLMHGVRVPGIPSFDLDVENGSLAADIAAAGHAVYIMDARGFGYSTRPDGPSPVARSNEVVRDIRAVVEYIRKDTGSAQIACFGWATGGHWLGYYSALYPDTISHIVFYITLYPAEADHPLLGHGSHLEDPKQHGAFARAAHGAYVRTTREILLDWWDQSIPCEDKSAWRDPALVERYVAAAMASDVESAAGDPPCFRSPAGAMEDSFYLATGHRFWDASLISARALVISAGRDFWARPSDRDKLVADLVSARSVAMLDLPGSTHYAHLDRPQHGRAAILSGTLDFLADGEPLPVSQGVVQSPSAEVSSGRPVAPIETPMHFHGAMARQHSGRFDID
jgi:pimeloyl-ACP methyl ester carboxylesterase